MRAFILFLTLTLLKAFNLHAQTVDFAFTALLILNTNNEGFSVCENFRKHEKLKFLFHHDQTCYYKAIFEESKADSVIIKVGSDKDPVFDSNTSLPEINLVEYYHNFETAKREYLRTFRQIQQELLSKPQFYKSGKIDRFDDKWSNDTSFLAKECCYDLPEFYVYKHFQIRSPLVFGSISTDLQCRQHLYLIIVSVKLK
jgi:hypothetical protein